MFISNLLFGTSLYKLFPLTIKYKKQGNNALLVAIKYSGAIIDSKA